MVSRSENDPRPPSDCHWCNEAWQMSLDGAQGDPELLGARGTGRDQGGSMGEVNGDFMKLYNEQYIIIYICECTCVYIYIIYIMESSMWFYWGFHGDFLGVNICKW